METEIIEFLREKFREKMGRNVGGSEINDFIRFAEVKAKKFKDEISLEFDEYMLQYNCRKCNSGQVQEDGYCETCKICIEHNIADFNEFKKFFKDNSIVGGVSSTYEQDGRDV